MDARRTNAERSEETRTALLAAARELFAERGYGGTPTETIVEHAGVTRGALYYHFKDKPGLFRSVFAETDMSMMQAISQSVERAEGDDWQRIMAGTQTFLELCGTRDIQRILYTDGPVVLGADWPSPMGLTLVRQSLTVLMSQGYIAEQPLEPLTHMLFGSLVQGALYVVRADDKDAARQEIWQALGKLMNGLLIKPGPHDSRSEHAGQLAADSPGAAIPPLPAAAISDAVIFYGSD